METTTATATFNTDTSTLSVEEIADKLGTTVFDSYPVKDAGIIHVDLTEFAPGLGTADNYNCPDSDRWFGITLVVDQVGGDIGYHLGDWDVVTVDGIIVHVLGTDGSVDVLAEAEGALAVEAIVAAMVDRGWVA